MIQSGYPFYGQNVGILVFSTDTPRVPGDAGHANTFLYPVCYEVVKGSFIELVKGSTTIRKNLLDAVQHLKAKGVSGVIGDCGLMSLYQNELAEMNGIIVATSSLCQISLIWTLIGRLGKIGILTGHSDLLSKRHLLSSGWTEDIPIVIQGMEMEPHFDEIVIKGGASLNLELMEYDVRSACRKLMEQSSDIRAVIVECSNLATYSHCIREEIGVPVFDLISIANLVSYGVFPPTYQ